MKSALIATMSTESLNSVFEWGEGRFNKLRDKSKGTRLNDRKKKLMKQRPLGHHQVREETEVTAGKCPSLGKL